jgi:hypothetical protein
VWPWSTPAAPSLTREERNDLVRMIIRMDAKLDLILDELEIGDGEEED